MSETSRRKFHYPDTPGDLDLLETIEKISLRHRSSFSWGIANPTIHAWDARGEVTASGVLDLRGTELAQRDKILHVQFTLRDDRGEREVVVDVWRQHLGRSEGYVRSREEVEAIGLSEKLGEAVENHLRLKRRRRWIRFRSWWSGHSAAVQILMSIVGSLAAAGLIGLVATLL